MKNHSIVPIFTCVLMSGVCGIFSVEGLRVLVICALVWCEVSLYLPSSWSAVFTDPWELRTSEYRAF